MLIKTTICITAAMATVACGSNVKSKSSESGSGQESVEASLTVSTVDSAGLALLATTSTFSGSVVNCITGQAPTFNESSASVKLLVGDTGCYAKLRSISVRFGDGTSAIYAPDASYQFASGTAVIVSSAGSSRVMKIAVDSNIPSTVAASPAPQINMTISFVDFGGSQTATVKTATAGIDVDVNNVLPYQLATVDLTVNGSTGGGAFDAKLNCYDTVGADNSCSGMAQGTLKGALAIDSYKTAGVGRDLTLAECTSLSTGASSSLPADTAVALDADIAMPNGGASFLANGPSPLCDAANSKLVFALSHPSSASCKWWRIEVACP